jgi:hypothetical protein
MNASTLSIDWLQLISELLAVVLPESDDILSSPVKLGSLLRICTEFAEIEPIVREQAITLALQKHDIPGFALVHRDGSRFVEAEHLLKLALGCPVTRLEAFLSALVKQLGSVSAAKYQTLCEATGLTPDTDVIRQAGATVFLRRNSK